MPDTESQTLVLPPLMDIQASAALKDEWVNLPEVKTIDGSSVERITTPGWQLLHALIKEFSVEEPLRCQNPSEAMVASAKVLGFSSLLEH